MVPGEFSVDACNLRKGFMGCFAAFMFLFTGVTAAHYILMILMFRCLTKDLHELPVDCNLGPAALKSAPFVKGWPPCAFANISKVLTTGSCRIMLQTVYSNGFMLNQLHSIFKRTCLNSKRSKTI